MNLDFGCTVFRSLLYRMLQILLTHFRIGKLYRAYKDMEDVGMNFAEFDYNQKDYVGEGTHLMPGSR